MGCGASQPSAPANALAKQPAIPQTAAEEASAFVKIEAVKPAKLKTATEGKLGWAQDEVVKFERLETGDVSDNGKPTMVVDVSAKSFMRPATPELENGSPDEVLQELLNGNMRFIRGETQHPHQDARRLQQIAPKQKPIAAILACADSRVPVEIVFDQGFGDIFVCR
eukprot:CAMPEP_0202895904 /NCGR_PEP_ID=MMETSP1392-20130828/5014_1 /ASSEMBLY_ACC=CAM_ASM_000868 /TAXON_ID=225041 /ORGANISM="Chlamydomonas chlamydogama, Strain SAG 11-48b" /LENGTH=166 /DNA_ID=CAMNT_0049581079 /DNA_START=316 /DNA_END=812 /DNA_ORIENTATION=+